MRTMRMVLGFLDRMIGGDKSTPVAQMAAVPAKAAKVRTATKRKSKLKYMQTAAGRKWKSQQMRTFWAKWRADKAARLAAVQRPIESKTQATAISVN